MIKECLGYSSMRLGVPFIAPRHLGAVGTQQGRQFLPSVGWRTGQSGAPPDNHCSMSGADLLPFLAQPTVGSSGWLAHRTLSGTYRTVRCPQPTVGWGHASRADCAADRCTGGRWLTGQSGAPPDNHCSMSGADLLPFLAQPTVGSSGWLAHRTLSGAHRTVRCPYRPLERATRRPRICRPTVALVTVGSPDSPVHPRTVR
jgi:hypothetical protein